jgi:hypothetical protein
MFELTVRRALAVPPTANRRIRTKRAIVPLNNVPAFQERLLSGATLSTVNESVKGEAGSPYGGVWV